MGKVAKSKTSNKSTTRARRRRQPFSAPFAVMSDGRVMIDTRDCTGHSLKGREIYKGAILTPKESRSILKNIEDGLAFAASSIVRQLPTRSRRGHPSTRGDAQRGTRDRQG